MADRTDNDRNNSRRPNVVNRETAAATDTSLSTSLSLSLSTSLSQSEFEDVPLTVESEGKITTQIEDTGVPEANTKIEGDINPWWSWIPVIGGAIGIVDGLKKKKEDKDEEISDKNDEETDE